MATKKYDEILDIPGESGLPIVGNLFQMLKEGGGYYDRLRAKYGDVYKSRSLFGSGIILTGPTAVKFFLVEQSKFTSSQEAWEKSLGTLFPNGLMLMDGDRHKYHRSIMHEAFKKDPMQGYVDIMPNIISNAIDQLEGKDEVLFFPFAKELTISLASEVFFGITDSKEIAKLNEAITNIVNAALAIPISLPFTKYGRGLKGRRFLVDYFRSIIDERRNQPGKDLFSRLCIAKNEDGDTFTDQEIIDHLIFVLMAAHDTTAITVSFLTYFLAKHPDWQKVVLDEINAFDFNAPLQVKDLRQLENLGLVMKETLRIHPPLVTVTRKLEKDITFEGYTLPKDALISLMFHCTHRDVSVWDDTDKFDPLRFSKERREEQRCPFAYAPFGAGPHHCIGYQFAELQIKLVISELIKRYEVSVPEGYECPIRDFPLKQPTDNLPITLKRRS